MFNCKQFQSLILKPALEDLILYSDNAIELLTFTCAVESDGGKYLKQINGPALGAFQMEPKTYNDLWVNFINNRNDIRLRLIHGFGIQAFPHEDRLVYDLRFAAAMTRIFYERLPLALPDANDIDSVWEYYKAFYNTDKGDADKAPSIAKYNQFKKS